jgi:hypothetical protein
MLPPREFIERSKIGRLSVAASQFSKPLTKLDRRPVLFAVETYAEIGEDHLLFLSFSEQLQMNRLLLNDEGRTY